MVSLNILRGSGKLLNFKVGEISLRTCGLYTTSPESRLWTDAIECSAQNIPSGELRRPVFPPADSRRIPSRRPIENIHATSAGTYLLLVGTPPQRRTLRYTGNGAQYATQQHTS